MSFNFSNPTEFTDNLKIFHTVFETDKSSKWREVLEPRIPLRLGSMTDCFMHMDRKFKVTLEVLKILKYYKYPYVVFTRSDLIAEAAYLNEIDPELTAVQFSICGTSDKATKLIEPGAPSLERRLKALCRINERGIWTTVRLNPLFPTFPDGYFSDQDEIIKRFGSMNNVPKLDFFDIDMIDEFLGKIKDAGCSSLLVGFVRLSPKSIHRITESTSVDFKSFFKPDLYKIIGDKRYSDLEIAKYYSMIASACKKSGVRFNTCYIGQGLKDYYQYQKLWTNKNDCCDAKGNVPGIKKSCQEVDWSYRIKRSPCKEAAEQARLIDYTPPENLIQ